MPIVAKLDELGKPAWIALMILAFFLFWPLGLAILAFALWSGRMGCGHYPSYGRWQHKLERMQSKMDRLRERMTQSQSWGPSSWGHVPSSGNRAFDEYRNDTLHRLEEEQREFHDFLGRLRMAKDKVEFDQFMAERRNRPGPESQPQA
jgi:hypothetical protein